MRWGLEAKEICVLHTRCHPQRAYDIPTHTKLHHFYSFGLSMYRTVQVHEARKLL